MFIDDDEGTNDAVLTHQTLIDTQERLGSLLDLMPTGLVIHQMQGILYANQQALALFDQTSDQMIGQHILDYVGDDIRDECSELFMSTFNSDLKSRFPEIEIKTRTGITHFIKATAGYLPWEGTSVIQILLEDVTEMKQQADILRRLTFHDVLTGAYNRRYFIEQAEKVIEQAKANTHPFSLLIFDVDLFKNINDTYGHLAGDEALKAIIKVWNENTRHIDTEIRVSDDTLARIGGEEFAIILPNSDIDAAKVVAERIRAALEEHIIEYEDQKFSITASFGLTSLKPEDQTLDDLIRRADRALYTAKEQGRNRVCISE